MATARVIKSGRRGEVKGEIKAASREVRLSALKGLEALPAATRVATVYSLLYDSDTRVRAVARKELLTLPIETLQAFVEGGGHAKVLDFLIRNLPKNSPTMPVLVSAPNLAHRTRQFAKSIGIEIKVSAPAAEPEPKQNLPPTVPPARPSDDTPVNLEATSPTKSGGAGASSDGALDIDLEWRPPTDADFELPDGVEFSMPVASDEKDKAKAVKVKTEVELGDTHPALPLKPKTEPKLIVPPPPPAKPIAATPPPVIPPPAPAEEEHDDFFKPISPVVLGKMNTVSAPAENVALVDEPKDPFQPIPPSKFSTTAPPPFKPMGYTLRAKPIPPKTEPEKPVPVIEMKAAPPEPTLRPQEPELGLESSEPEPVAAPPEPALPQIAETKEALPASPTPELPPVPDKAPALEVTPSTPPVMTEPAVSVEPPVLERPASSENVLFPVLESREKAPEKPVVPAQPVVPLIVAAAPVAAMEMPVRHSGFTHGLLAGVLIGGIVLIGYVTVSRYLPGLIEKISSSQKIENPQPIPPSPAPPSAAPAPPPVSHAPPVHVTTPPPRVAPPPVVRPAPRSDQPVDLFLGVFTSMGSLRAAQKKAEEIGLVTEFTKKEEEKTTWSIGTGASGTREDADRKAAGIRSLGIPAHVSGGTNGRWGISCGSASTQEAAQKRAIALRASGYGGHVSENKRKQTTYTLRVRNVPAASKDEIIEKLKTKGLKAREL